MKRTFDIIFSAFLILILAPVLIGVAILVRLKIGSPIIFSQYRPGLNETPFRMFKFRTMTDERDADGNLLPDEMRFTNFGRRLRRLSLDELPELFNILRGDMSMVGPRPLLIKYIPYYTEKERGRHSVRPGLTGLAQISGRNAITWEEKLSLDIFYIENRNFLMDIKIVLKTVAQVYSRQGVLEAAPQGALDKYRASFIKNGANHD